MEFIFFLAAWGVLGLIIGVWALSSKTEKPRSAGFAIPPQ